MSDFKEKVVLFRTKDLPVILDSRLQKRIKRLTNHKTKDSCFRASRNGRALAHLASTLTRSRGGCLARPPPAEAWYLVGSSTKRGSPERPAPTGPSFGSCSSGCLHCGSKRAPRRCRTSSRPGRSSRCLALSEPSCAA